MPLIDSVSNRPRSSRSQSPKRHEDQLKGDRVADRKTLRSARISTQADVILPMREPYMQQIVNGEKNYEFRKYRLKASVKRIWFYSTAPQSSIEYVCEILPAKTRNAGDLALEEDGLGNKEFNERHKDWEGYDFAYEVTSV
ncbi:PUA [Glarea lozoyensis ATCC 20868]|uniref:PUA n=1 Tax=Glarea lozoyensis (strain ATCC 20868 / MF5171) TaxID=1116229 RepID=S3DH35_GLAL2|nr:PUA [Glarea lozoyensis ATCC 20868]EPE31321.1 PUA [Glarea lozoyensis ATCC 20868]